MTMIEMSSERWNRLTETGEALTEAEMLAGWHWCYDWDDMLVGPGMPEAMCCNCGVPAVNEWKTSDEARRLAQELEERNEREEADRCNEHFRNNPNGD